jgi:hypothetical protein
VTTGFDALRADLPHLGFAVYAMEAGGAVTMEVFTPDGSIQSVTRPTFAECVASLFPAPDLGELFQPTNAPAAVSDDVFG